MSGGSRSLLDGSDLLRTAELGVADALGDLMELWGFRRQLGRLWAILFLSDRPLAAPELCDRLQISTGLLSMTLTELRSWGAVHRIAVPGDRKEHFAAETHVWSLVRGVLAERERKAIDGALSTLEVALGQVRAALGDANAEVKAQARFRQRRIEQLMQLCRVGQGLLRMLLESARLDIGPLKLLSDLLGGPARIARDPPPTAPRSGSRARETLPREGESG